METVKFELINRIFYHINRTEKQSELLPDRKKWNRLTSALITLEDSSCAIEYYIETAYPTDFRGKYLFAYGLFQAIILQQDSINSIKQALFNESIEFKKEFPDAYKVREIRNDTTGHPTNRGGNKFITISQQSMCKNGFSYCKDDGEDLEKDEMIDVDVMTSIEDTAKVINTVLQKAVEDLDKEFKEYIEKHRDRKMTDIFNLLRYAKEKSLTDLTMCDWGYNATKKMVIQCENELEQRYGSIETIDSYKYLLDDIHELYALIDDVYKISSESQERLKYFLMELLFVKLEELESFCKETDAYFENYGETVTAESEKFKDATMKIEIPEMYKNDNELME